jgi:hypothetical protein
VAKFGIRRNTYIDAANLSSCNNTELDLLQTEGEGIPKEMVKKLAENKFKHPESTYHLCHQFNNWYGVLQICFGENSLLSKRLELGYSMWTSMKHHMMHASNWIQTLEQNY